MVSNMSHSFAATVLFNAIKFICNFRSGLMNEHLIEFRLRKRHCQNPKRERSNYERLIWRNLCSISMKIDADTTPYFPRHFESSIICCLFFFWVKEERRKRLKNTLNIMARQQKSFKKIFGHWIVHLRERHITKMHHQWHNKIQC